MSRQVNYPDIGLRLKEIRKHLKIKQNAMAQALDVQSTYLCDIEAGKGNPGPDFFKKLASQYNVDLNYLIMGTGKMFNQNENPHKPKPVEFEISDGIDDIEKLIWLIEKSPYFKNMALGACNKILINDEELIRKSISKKIISK